MRYSWILLLFVLSACTPSAVEDAFLGGVALSTARSTLAVSNESVAAGGTVTVRLSTRDQKGNPYYVPGSRPTVTFSSSGGTSTGNFSPVTDQGNGVFLATFTGITAGTPTRIQALHNGVPVGPAAQVEVIGTLTGFNLTSATVSEAGKISLSWANSTGATSYAVKYGTSSGNYTTTFASSATSPTVITGLTAGNTYYFMVTASNGSASIDANSEISAKPLGSFSISSVDSGVGNAVVNWGASGGATTYDLLYDTVSRTGGGTYASVVSGANTGATVGSLSTGTTYYFRVRANNAAGSVLSSNEIAAAPYQSFSHTFPFTNSTDYLLSDSDKLEITGGVARLRRLSQTDDENTSSEFGAATLSGLAWDGAASLLRLNTATNTAELDASWAPQWDRLIAYWKMNGGWGDSSSGGTQTANRSGTGTGFTAARKLGSHAGSFNGTDDYATVGSSLGSPPAITLSGWVNSAAGTTNADMLSFGNRLGIRIDASATGVTGFFFGGGATNNLGANITISGTGWHHIAYTVAAGAQRLYIDGELRAQDSNANAIDYTGVSSVTIGKNGSSAANFTNGMLDEIAVWDRALSAGEVNSIYQRQAAKLSGQITSRIFDATTAQTWSSLQTSTTFPYGKEMMSAAAVESSLTYPGITANFATNRFAYYKLNEASYSTASGSVIDSASGYPSAFASAGIVSGAGIFGGAAVLSSTSGAFTLNGSSSYLAANRPLTLSAWVKPKKISATTSPGNTIFSARSTISTTGLAMALGDSKKLVLRNGFDSTTLISSGDLSIGHWNLVVVTFDGSCYRLYVNGKDDGVCTAGTMGAGISNRSNLGADATLANSAFEGMIDEFSAWSRALTPADIRELYRRGANRIKYQLRTCANADCSDQDALTNAAQGWKGPDNTARTYFSEIYNTTGNTIGSAPTAAALSLSFSNFSGSGLTVPSARFFQYRAVLESDDANNLCTYGGSPAACSPDLKSVEIGPVHYDSSGPSVTSKASASPLFQTLSANGFIETATCASGLRYALSSDGITFYYWDGSAWATSNSSATAANASATSTNLGSFASTAGAGTLQVKTFLMSSGTSTCEADSVQVSGNRY